MATEEPWTIDAANDADIAEQTIPVEPSDLDPEAPVVEEVPTPGLEVNPADLVEQSIPVGSDDSDDYPPVDE
ncbi:hypothetical protein ACN93_09160 [Gordonia paraffinivorans]|uniref:hypothetical protein n=1 Tax=Gordonia paraffinivorans TaxID=175628 RepID=UPI000D619740|nr:hypothetical protein [Gordonia paraffinivorans]PWD43532.1 hypothetical protein ACN93_09160 [Gordonia paraffinivorans]